MGGSSTFDVKILLFFIIYLFIQFINLHQPTKILVRCKWVNYVFNVKIAVLTSETPNKGVELREL